MAIYRHRLLFLAMFPLNISGPNDIDMHFRLILGSLLYRGPTACRHRSSATMERL